MVTVMGQGLLPIEGSGPLPFEALVRLPFKLGSWWLSLFALGVLGYLFVLWCRHLEQPWVDGDGHWSRSASH